MNKFEDIRGVAFDLDGTLVDMSRGEYFNPHLIKYGGL